MAILDLKVHLRKASGKGGARQIRGNNQVPGILYGKDAQEGTPITVDANMFKNVLAKRPTMLRLLNNEIGTSNCILREVQRHPVTGSIIHFDLQAVNVGEKVKMTLSVRLVGVPIGVKDFGGVMDHINHHIEVELNPLEAPDFLLIDVTKIGLNEKVKVSDIKLQGDMTILSDPDEIIALVIPSKVTADAPVSTEVAQPEVITEKKKDKETE